MSHCLNVTLEADVELLNFGRDHNTAISLNKQKHTQHKTNAKLVKDRLSLDLRVSQ